MFAEQLPVLGYVFIVVIGNPQIEYDIEDHREIEKRKI